MWHTPKQAHTQTHTEGPRTPTQGRTTGASNQPKTQAVHGEGNTQGSQPQMRQQGSKATTAQGERTTAKQEDDIPAAARVVGCCGLQDARQQRRGEHARSHIAHKRNNEESYVTTKGRRKIHIPPPIQSPSHAGPAPTADKAAVLATEPRGHTTRGEEREDGMDGEGRGQRAPRRKRSKHTHTPCNKANGPG